MPSRHVSIRMDQDAYERLAAQSRRNREPVSQLAKRLIEEGLRMQAHPGIVFREAPSGRRPALVGGPSVWVVARVLRDKDLNDPSTLDEACELTDLSKEKVQTAARYYADYRQELDDWMDLLDQEADKAYADWLQNQPVASR